MAFNFQSKLILQWTGTRRIEHNQWKWQNIGICEFFVKSISLDWSNNFILGVHAEKKWLSWKLRIFSFLQRFLKKFRETNVLIYWNWFDEIYSKQVTLWKVHTVLAFKKIFRQTKWILLFFVQILLSKNASFEKN